MSLRSTVRPAHLLGLAGIIAATVVLQPVAATAAGTLVSIADSVTGNTAKVDGSGRLLITGSVKAVTADSLVTLGGGTAGPGGGTQVTVNTAGYRDVQIYARPRCTSADVFTNPCAGADGLTVWADVDLPSGADRAVIAELAPPPFNRNQFAVVTVHLTTLQPKITLGPDLVRSPLNTNYVWSVRVLGMR